MSDLKKALEKALTDYEKRKETAFSDWHRMRNGELLAQDIKKILADDKKPVC